MGFASAWLAKNALFPRLIDADPDAGTGIIVVIPACGEGDIQSTINSLAHCKKPPCNCEVIVIVNAPAKASDVVLKENKRTISLLKVWRDNNNCFFRLFCFDPGTTLIPAWGVGHARKAGMDEASRRFDDIGNPQGIIASLDADCLVSENYFTGLYDMLLTRPERSACSISLINGRDDEDFPEEITLAAEQYELERRYMLFGLRYAGFPWCFNTSGAAMAVKAGKYIKTGGMNTREAGEDFWFIRKLMPAGGFFHANNITVYHSSRTSHRVPFGTGMSIDGKLNSAERNQTITDPQLFEDLKELWKGATLLFNSTKQERVTFYALLPATIREFLPEARFIEETDEISGNTGSAKNFARRYYARYDLLFSIRYLNFTERKKTVGKGIIEACTSLAHKAGFPDCKITSVSSALIFLRASEAWISYSPF
jgi:hypothetical protein